MIVLLSPEQPVTDESTVINTLFDKGLPLFHIRKHLFSDQEMVDYVDRIDRGYRQHVVLHSHFHLAQKLRIERLHIRDADRSRGRYQNFIGSFRLSTSVHSIAAFNALDALWDYAFFSPVFPSISKKGYGSDQTVLDDLSLRTNPNVKLVGLGGIDAQNYKQVFTAGADAIALLGAVWNNSEPIKVFETLYKNSFHYY